MGACASEPKITGDLCAAGSPPVGWVCFRIVVRGRTAFYGVVCLRVNQQDPWNTYYYDTHHRICLFCDSVMAPPTVYRLEYHDEVRIVGNVFSMVGNVAMDGGSISWTASPLDKVNAFRLGHRGLPDDLARVVASFL